ncbi:protein kinase domain-containing protein [Wenjunlia tyrosinilytica]|uniref:non-specific serine/threonine protein kinase n=1 Tax=Wenjunlia tyrosinilytica TaxID=1544741 RepID=A0A917ZLH4_9ACTN|nr:protein kinase [Wenjunlia tyrosinilytica]GGO84586.1 serine/threonine-protein kinase PksC [Wenjunlia tyrosinilytica]
MSGDGAQGGDVKGRSVGNGRYELQHLLGQGGMASVHLAYDTVLDRRVAVKTLHTELGREQSFRERFRREAQAVAKLNHTNIVSVFDSGEDVAEGAAVPYIVMEYVEGKPLRDVLDEDVAAHGAMPAEKALKITADVLAALEASHEMGLVHRDIKPGNVMVTQRGVVKVMDFGIARALQSGVTSMTQTGMVVGTPQYLSPEQALGRGVDARSDLYSVGCMLFELLTGRLPFEGDSPLSIAYQHVQEEPVAPSTINQAVPPAVDALVARALKKNPAERFPTAESMRDEAVRVNRNENTGNTPLIISEGPRANSSAVANAVFPPVPGSLPGAHGNLQTPYQPPTPPPAFGPQTPPPNPGPMPHRTPIPNQMNMGAPHGMQTPPPPPGQATPAPFNISPQPGPGMRPQTSNGGGCSTAMIVVGVVLGVIALVVAIIVVAAVNSNDKKADPDPVSSSTYTPSTTAGATGGSSTEPSDTPSAEQSIKPGTSYNNIKASACTQAYKDSKGEVLVPSFKLGKIEDARDCAEAAGWKLIEKKENETLYGQGIVVDQSPHIEYVDPKNLEITVWVSTGHE